MNNSIPTVAIIGGGFCGIATLIQLTKQTDIPLKIILINKDNPLSRGIAFSTYNSKHVLNVPAVKMSALPEDPDNFINWIKSKPEYIEFVNDELNDRFLPRVIYGNYLEELFNETLKTKSSSTEILIYDDEAIDIIPEKNHCRIILKKGEPVQADKAVLALGNFLPDNPKIKDPSFYKSSKYFNNPWAKSTVKEIDKEDNILIIGTGLTMVDNVLSLIDEGFRGKIFAISTKGFFPLSHKKRKPYTDILNELHPPYTITQLYKVFRKHIKYVLANGITGEAVVDAVRPKTQEIWLSLTYKDKIRFMSHIRHLWGVARHRLPKEIFDKMQDLISKDKLEIIGGRLQTLEESDGSVKVVFKEKKSQQLKELKVQRVINCTGPLTDLNKVNIPLIKNLLSKGLISADELKLGINALPDGTILQKDHSVSNFLFTLGSMLKGILWESTAVPELRVQAKALAGELIRQLSLKSRVET